MLISSVVGRPIDDRHGMMAYGAGSGQLPHDQTSQIGRGVVDVTVRRMPSLRHGKHTHT